MALVILDRCTGCGACLSECPTHAIVMNKKKADIDPDLCCEIKFCVSVCPVDAIISAEQALEEKIG